MQVLTCQCCRDLHHECYGLADQVCSQCQCNKKTCQDIVVKGVVLCLPPVRLHADTLVVISAPVAPCQGRQTVAPVKPLTQAKWVATKGKATSHPATRPQACKVTQVASPTPEAMALITPVAGLS